CWRIGRTRATSVVALGLALSCNHSPGGAASHTDEPTTTSEDDAGIYPAPTSTASTQPEVSPVVSGDGAAGSGAMCGDDVSPSDASTARPSYSDEPVPTVVPDLEPTVDCVHPEVIEDCEDGFCFVPEGCFIMGVPRDAWGAGAYSDVQVQV